ncbi:TTF-type domain-containing protein [Citrus sinensis]|uniref:Rhodanese domain-containing protein n=1 Tax=Citrus clementina TaxID=85681 RepID=V4U7Z6_CITCL|nr:hypothetical protein CICLE_v10017783mg [Citrus x clementina]KAH9743248.1 TTF-type domain-containing protein [Citrus sinensis]
MYISIGLYQPKLEEFPPSFIGQQLCRFQYTWYAQFPWLEYSKEIDVFTIEGFRSWKRINNGERCSFLHHKGRLNSHNTKAMLKWGGLKNLSQHINRVMNGQSLQPILQNFEISASTLKKEICNVLTRYNLLVKDLRGQGYNDVSNMRGAWNELQTLFREDCPYAYYVHCFTHRLQLTLVKVSKDRHSELKSIREAKIIDLIASGELEIDIRANQICSLQRPRATLWSSHFTSISRLISMFGVVHEYFKKMICNGSNNDIREEAKGVYDAMSTFKFVFILHLMNKVLGINDLLCQTLQMKSQDILNTIHLISTTKLLLQSFRENDWDTFTKNVISFCESHHIDVPEMNDRHMKGMMHSCLQKDYVIVEHYYRIDLVNAVIDF